MRLQSNESGRPRRAGAGRKTNETEISMDINLDGRGECKLDTQVPFFEHMLSHIAKHGLVDLELRLLGDIDIDAHHSVEDAGILFGALLNEALGDKAGIQRYGHCTLPMDEVLASVSVDLGGRFHFAYRGPDSIREGKFGNYDAELTLEFLEKFAMNAKMNLHVQVHYGENRHHIHEAIFKALGRALRMATAIDERRGAEVPSTKGVL